jgi:exopolysaccharide biosynthesis polyprenyl glycosylphosphotransferase
MALSVSAPFTREEAASIWRKRPPVYAQPPRVRSDALALRKARMARSEPADSRTKRLVDIVGASVALLFFAPLFLAIAIAIKASSRGPVLFRQYRYGYRNRRFRIYKFRTMYTELADLTGVRQTVADDPRVTPIGRILRNTSLDELPQLINVLKGDMSLVGPRPHVPGMLAADLLYEDLVPYYFQRHAVKPGITGLAQVSGCRGSTADAYAAIARIDFDLDYIETWSLRLDCRILLRTLRQEFLSGSGT